jgi:hypothetical protein
MTSIPALGGPTPGIAPARTPVAPPGGFAVPAPPAPSRGAEAASALAPSAVLAGLLALQEEAEPQALRDRAARRHGRTMLTALAELQLALLAGPGEADDGAPARALARLGHLLDEQPPAEDPALAGVLAAVALRCRVELARRR